MAFLYPFINLWQPGILWPWLAPLRPMLLISIVAAIIGISNRKTNADLQADYFNHPAFRWFLFYVFVNIISVYYSGFSSLFDEFNSWYIYPLFFAISFLLMSDEKSLRRYVWGMMGGGAFVVTLGLIRALSRPHEDWGKPSGAYGLYDNHNDFTFLALTMLPYAWMLFIEYKKFLPRLFLGLLALGSMGAIMVSLSRGGILVLALEVAMLGWASTRGGQRAVMMTLILMMAPIAVHHQFSAREEGTTNDYTAETAKTSRYELWTAAGRMIIKHPFLGVGSRRFKEFSSDYNEISHDNKGKVAHNTYLEIAAGSGLLGIISYIMMLTGALRPLTRAVGKAVVGGATERDSLAPIRIATFIALLCIVVRALLDVKIFDSCIFTLITLSITSMALSRKQASVAAEHELAQNEGDAPAPSPFNEDGLPVGSRVGYPGANYPALVETGKHRVLRPSSSVFPASRRM